jgi:hypothetical protein
MSYPISCWSLLLATLVCGAFCSGGEQHVQLTANSRSGWRIYFHTFAALPQDPTKSSKKQKDRADDFH